MADVFEAVCFIELDLSIVISADNILVVLIVLGAKAGEVSLANDALFVDFDIG